MIITHLKSRIERIFNKGVCVCKGVFEKPIKQPTAIVSFFVKEGEGDSTFIQRQIGFFF